jgi:hypothetical protein
MPEKLKEAKEEQSHILTIGETKFLVRWWTICAALSVMFALVNAARGDIRGTIEQGGSALFLSGGVMLGLARLRRT